MNMISTQINRTVAEPRRYVLLAALFFAFFCLAALSVTLILSSWHEYAESDSEYEELRLIYEPAVIEISDDQILLPKSATNESSGRSELVGGGESHDNAGDGGWAPAPVYASQPTPKQNPTPNLQLSEINPDYIGWLKIADTKVSYPMVRGENNSKYLNTSFEGYKNKLGAIFMDYRCTDLFNARHIIIYGHNVKSGSMFGSLHRFLDKSYLDSHRDIMVTLPDGVDECWRIFSARKSDINDLAYRLDFDDPYGFAAFAEGLGAPEGAARIMTLTTCTTGGSDDERIIVHAAAR